MKFAYVLSTKGGGVNELLSNFAAALQAEGVKITGTTQINTPRPKSHRCDMDVCVHPVGKVIRISQNLGSEASGCQLDASALEEAVALTSTHLGEAKLLIVNKFGRHEAEGHGFRDVIAEAIMQDIPVLVATSELNIEAFEAFAGGEAECLDASISSLNNWAHRCL